MRRDMGKGEDSRVEIRSPKNGTRSTSTTRPIPSQTKAMAILPTTKRILGTISTSRNFRCLHFTRTVAPPILASHWSTPTPSPGRKENPSPARGKHFRVPSGSADRRPRFCSTICYNSTANKEREAHKSNSEPCVRSFVVTRTAIPRRKTTSVSAGISTSCAATTSTARMRSGIANAGPTST